ncbi:hypothetical protein MX601_30195, partial [Escherichia coli]|nr:hypothetical protein [Escherichia coli]
ALAQAHKTLTESSTGIIWIDNGTQSLESASVIDRNGNANDGGGFAPIFPDICYHLTHYKPAAADIPVASDNPAHYADAIRYNA